eukprot:c12402_g1_i1.p1 GENE.c12402_g1_i1~~c12402_g1_i1.p1  ORF type:complete len:596 (-),score=311.56 c12402_g1_i1:8-1756(-)
MASILKNSLPTPKNLWQDEMLDDLDDLDASTKIREEDSDEEGSTAMVSTGGGAIVSLKGTSGVPRIRRAPPYLKRRNWMPRELEDFDDGGAFPEIHMPQYPLKMGMSSKQTGNTLAVEVDEQGNVKYDAIATSRMRKGTWVHSSFKDMVEKNPGEEELAKPGEEDINETTERTKRELEKLVSVRIQSSKPNSQAIEAASQKKGPTYLRYTPQEAGGTFNSGAKQRVVSLVEAQRDPLEPPKHRHKKVAGGIPSPPPPVQHSPPKKLTVQEQRDWKIPSCISNWKNPKGFTIPLDKRMAADGSSLQETQMNNNFGQFVEALYIAERTAREEVKKRNELQKKKLMKEQEAQEQLLRDLAAKTRMERAGLVTSKADPEAKQRETIREDRKREREDDRRASMKKSKTSRDRERDISEQIALGQAGNLVRKGEGIYDSRLFNQDQGLSHGLEQEDAYNIYDKPLMSGSSANQLYRPNKATISDLQDDEDPLVNSLLSSDTSKFKPDKGFKGAQSSSSSSKRDRPIAFEKADENTGAAEEEETDDPFGLEDFMNKAKGGRQSEQTSSRGSGGGGDGSSRSRVNFTSGR